MCLPPATRTGGEIRKSPAKAASRSGQRLEAERNASAFSPLRDETPDVQAGRQAAPVQGGALVSLDQALYNKTVLVRGVRGRSARPRRGGKTGADAPPPECAQPGG